jgi:hypothetical protein
MLRTGLGLLLLLLLVLLHAIKAGEGPADFAQLSVMDKWPVLVFKCARHMLLLCPRPPMITLCPALLPKVAPAIVAAAVLASSAIRSIIG